MAAKDIYHDSCVHALQKNGWTVTHEPLTVTVQDTNLLIDIAAERLVTAERGNERIAVEVKSFVSLSAVQDLKEAVGQFLLYKLALQQSPTEQDRLLFLAVRSSVYNTVFLDGIGKLFLDSNEIRLLVFNPDTEEIVTWVM
jgi:hypothetical protein